MIDCVGWEVSGLCQRSQYKNLALSSPPLPLPPLLQTTKRMLPYLFVRGDGVILISPASFRT